MIRMRFRPPALASCFTGRRGYVASIASVAALISVLLWLAVAPAHNLVPRCENGGAALRRIAELERQLVECAASKDLCLRGQPVPSGEHYLVSSKHRTGVHHFVVRCAVWLFCGPLVQSCAGEELLHDVQATDVPLVDSSVPAGGGLVKDAIGPLLSRHNCFARSAAPSHGCADGTAWWWANRQLLQSAAGTQRLPPVLGGTRIGDCVA